MAKGSNNVKPKRSHLYKPYDSANSSLVSRLTSRVSEILPQPSSWLSRWLAPGEQSTFSQNESENDDDDAVQQPPPSKKLRRSNDVAIRLNQNHVYQKIDSEPELSPILRNRSDQLDGAIPGPSGLHLRGVDFVASTPAVPIASSSNDPAGKINGGDEGSDGSESTSGCSSLVPQREMALTAPYKANIKKTSIETPKLSCARNSLSIDNSRLSLKPKNHGLDTSMPLYKNRSSFDAYAFNNPLNKSLSFNSTLNKTREESFNSPFYRGRTMYGGNASCKESLSLSLVSPKVGTPKIVSVRPTPNLTQSRETISTSALKILRAIEQFSSPVTDAKKMPVRTESERRKRKAVQPFEDLVIPTMPDLLRIKRRQRVVSESSSTNSTSSATATPKPYQLPPPVQPLSAREEATEPKRVMKGKHIEEMKAERVDKVDLPSIPLPLTSLPSFTLNSLPLTPLAPSTPTPAITSVVPLSSATTVPLPTFTFSSSVEKTTSTSFKFSTPIVEKEDDSSIVAIKSTLTFQAPLEADLQSSDIRKENNKGSSRSTATSKGESLPVVNDVSGQSKLNFLPPSNQFIPKLKMPLEPKENANVPVLKTLINDKLGSVSSFLNKDKKSEDVKTDSQSLAKFKPPSGSWTCSSCLVPNKEDSSKCCCCETPKTDKQGSKPQTLNPPASKSENTWVCNQCSFKNKESVEVCVCGLKRGEQPLVQPLSKSFKDLTQKSSDSWECKECFVKNKNVDKTCAACSTPQPGAAKIDAPLPLSATFKIPEGTWECPTCMIGNKSSSTKCIACETLRPGATPASKSTSTFTFGIPNSSAPSALPVNFPATFTFGNMSSSSEKKTGTEGKSGFTFGTPMDLKRSAEETKDTNNMNFGASKMPNKIADELAETVPKKKVSFGDLPNEEKKSTDVVKQNQTPLFTFGGPSNVKNTEPSSTFILPNSATKRSPFGSTSVVASSSTDAKSSPEAFKFGSSSTGVSSSTDPATSASKSESAAPAFSLFGGDTAGPTKSAFPAPEKKQETVFGGMPTNPLFGSTNPIEAKPAFGMSGTSTNANVVDTSKNSMTNNLFAGNETKAIFGQSATTDKPPTNFFNSTDNKSGFFNSEASENKSIFGGAPVTEKWSKPSFTSTSNSLFDIKPAPAVSNTSNAFAPPSTASGTTVFGSQTAMLNTAESKPTFGALQGTSNATVPFMFKGIESASNANRPGFSLGAPNPVPSPSNTFSFNSESNFGTSQQNSLGLGTSSQAPAFGAPTTTPAPLFNNPAATPAPAPFGFLSLVPDQQQQFQPTFGFSAPQTQAAAPPFSFNVANSTPAPTPTFDPNIKPSFNFTGGAPTPTFAAPQTPANPDKPERKIRRAIRRTQPR